MSSAADASLVQQKKPDNDSVNWGEYTALKSHLSREFGVRCDKLGADLAATDAKIDKMQHTLDFLTPSMQSMTQRHVQPADDASVFVEDEAEFDGVPTVAHRAAPNVAPGGGRGGGRDAIIPHGRGLAHLDTDTGHPFHGARRVVRQPDEDGIGALKLTIPKFE